MQSPRFYPRPTNQNLQLSRFSRWFTCILKLKQHAPETPFIQYCICLIFCHKHSTLNSVRVISEYFPRCPADFVVKIPWPNWLTLSRLLLLWSRHPTVCYHLLLVQNQGRDLNKGLKLSVVSAFKWTWTGLKIKLQHQLGYPFPQK